MRIQDGKRFSQGGSLQFVPKARTPDLAVKLRDWAEDLPNKLELSSPEFRILGPTAQHCRNTRRPLELKHSHPRVGP
jgi:hypothetical protein